MKNFKLVLLSSLLLNLNCIFSESIIEKIRNNKKETAKAFAGAAITILSLQSIKNPENGIAKKLLDKCSFLSGEENKNNRNLFLALTACGGTVLAWKATENAFFEAGMLRNGRVGLSFNLNR